MRERRFDMSALRALPPGIWALGLGSLLMDTSSELVHSLLPVFMSSVLGASTVTIGLVEGIAEATASVTRVFSGVLSDALGRRKPLVVLGYGLGAASKPLFPLATSMLQVFAGRFVDRIGKGIRGAPRDALLADIAPPALRGAGYGLRQSLDSVGAFVGPLLAGLHGALRERRRGRAVGGGHAGVSLGDVAGAGSARAGLEPRDQGPRLSLAARASWATFLVVVLWRRLHARRFSEAFPCCARTGLSTAPADRDDRDESLHAAGAYPASCFDGWPADSPARRPALLVLADPYSLGPRCLARAGRRVALGLHMA
jgi:MFS family permease